MRTGPAAAAYDTLEAEYQAAFASRTTAATELARARHAGDPARLTAAKSAMRDRDVDLRAIRATAMELVRQTGGDRTFNDVNYIIPTFVLTQLPIGLVGLLVVGILMAATSTIAAELNALATATVMDYYKRRVRHSATDRHYLVVSRVATGLWGLFACAVAVWAAELGSLIEVVNRFGSFFYGSILGVFVLAIGFPRGPSSG
jgi:Na+(H+)/acetate symporter ActP